MTVTYVLTTDVGKVRLLIGDKAIATAHFTDEELTVFLADEGSVNLGAAAALEAWAAEYSANADSEKIGDYCLPTTAQALSRSGWCGPERLKIGDEIIAYDSIKDELKWAKVLDVHAVEYDGQMLKLQSGYQNVTFSTMASPNHRWYVRPLFHTAKWQQRIHKTTELNSWDRIPLSAQYNDGGIEPQWADDFVECVGWFVTEGNFQKNGVGIYAAFINQSQSANPESCERIRRCLSRLLWGDVPEHSHGDGNIGFYIGNKTWLYHSLRLVCPRKQLEMAFVNQLTASQLRLLLEVMLLGDGDKSRLRFYQQDNETMASFQAIAVMCGFGTYLTQKDTKKPQSEAVFSLSCLTKIYRGVKALLRGWVDYSGTIWCPNTALGTWLARDNGFTFITGNSYSQSIASKMLASAARLRTNAATALTAPAFGWGNYDLIAAAEDDEGEFEI